MKLQQNGAMVDLCMLYTATHIIMVFTSFLTSNVRFPYYFCPICDEMDQKKMKKRGRERGVAKEETSRVLPKIGKSAKG